MYTVDRVGGVGVASSVGRLFSSSAAALLPRPARPAYGTKRPATRTPARTLTMANIVSEYATLPTRFGLGTARGYASGVDPAESRACQPQDRCTAVSARAQASRTAVRRTSRSAREGDT